MPKFQFYSERLGLTFFGLALPLLIFPVAEDAFRSPQLISLSIVAILLGAAWSRALTLGLPTLLGLSYFGLRLLSQWNSGFRLEWSIEQGLYAFVYLWALAHLADPTRMRHLQRSLLAGAVVVSVYAILQSFGLDPLRLGNATLGFGSRPAATLGNPDFLGAYLALLFPLALHHSLTTGKRSWGPGIIGLALVLTQTRAAWLAASMATIYLLVMLRGRIKIRTFGMLLGIGLFFSTIFSFPNPLNPNNLRLASRAASAFHVASDDASGRFFMARAAFHIASQHPWLGAGDFTTAYLAEQGRMLGQAEHAAQPFRLTHDAHNDWLQVGAESGLVTLLVLALLFGMALRKGEIAWKALLVAAGVNALLNFPLSVPAVAALVFMALGAQLSIRGDDRRFPLATLLGMLGLLVFGRQLAASHLLNRGTTYSLLQRGSEAKPYLLKASQLQPNDQRIWMRLGNDADASADLALATLSFRHALAALPTLPEANANYGLALAKQGRLDEARDYSLRALSLNPNSVAALGNLGKIEYLRGDTARAEAAYRRGLRIDSNWAQGHFNLAAIYINTDQKSAARDQLKLLLKIDPKHSEAQELLKGLR